MKEYPDEYSDSKKQNIYLDISFKRTLDLAIICQNFHIACLTESSAGVPTRIEMCNLGFSNIQRDSFDTDKKALK